MLWSLLAASIVTSSIQYNPTLPNPKAPHAENIRKLCADEWKTDFAMQEYCIKQQRNGAIEFSRLYKEFPGDKRLIEPTLEKCIADWSKGDIINWMMVAYCARQQIDAYQRLRQ